MPYDPNQGQGQGHGDPKVATMANFTVYLLRGSAGMDIIKRLMMIYDTPKTIHEF